MVRPESKREGRFKGVRMRKWGKWVAEVRQPNSRERIWLGSYDTAHEAARAYDAAVFCLRGPSAFINFPNNPPPEVMMGAELSPSQIQVAASKHARRVDVRGPESAPGELNGGTQCAPRPLTPPVVENLFFEETSVMGNSSFCEEIPDMGKSCEVFLADGRGSGEFDESRMWNF